MTEAPQPPESIPTSEAFDFERAWESIVTDERNRWTTPGADEQFWVDHASEYEDRFVGQPEGIAVVDEFVGPDDSVLEIGPGRPSQSSSAATR